MADCEAQLEDPDIAEVEAALLEDHQVGVEACHLVPPLGQPPLSFVSFAWELAAIQP